MNAWVLLINKKTSYLKGKIVEINFYIFHIVNCIQLLSLSDLSISHYLFMDCQCKTEKVELILKNRQINKIIVFECKLINT